MAAVEQQDIFTSLVGICAVTVLAIGVLPGSSEASVAGQISVQDTLNYIADHSSIQGTMKAYSRFGGDYARCVHFVNDGIFAIYCETDPPVINGYPMGDYVEDQLSAALNDLDPTDVRISGQGQTWWAWIECKNKRSCVEQKHGYSYNSPPQMSEMSPGYAGLALECPDPDSARRVANALSHLVLVGRVLPETDPNDPFSNGPAQ